jgi:hypothetical protein
MLVTPDLLMRANIVGRTIMEDVFGDIFVN